jgi:hypothetical protein
MGALLQVLLRVLPAPSSHDSETEVEVDAQVETHWAIACCGDVHVDENSHESKDHHDDSSSVGG